MSFKPLNMLTPQEKKEGFVLLFDGKTIANWHGYGMTGMPQKDWADFLNVAHEGLIFLQDHGNDVWFRNIKIKKM